MSRMRDFCDIQCDFCGFWEPGRYRFTGNQRKFLATRGWKYVLAKNGSPAKDLCPTCAANTKKG